MKYTEFTIIDDSGLLSLVDCAAYASFISSDWTYEDIIAHFEKAMESKAMVVWDCGDGGDEYLVVAREGITTAPGFREEFGAIRVGDHGLHLVSYDALTMAAQFDDETLPSKFERKNCIELPAGEYRLRVVQTYDPFQVTPSADGAPHFIVEYESGRADGWGQVAWLRSS
ncbi:hypothetical protein [Duganella sp. Dugasp56]|uniref:hypothetical protein n=1 Tax=Duganella sp. Dugasp56 TaxID=3243046 RepID=UPI0039AFFFB5